MATVRREFTVPLPTGAPMPAVQQALVGDVPNLLMAAWRELAADHADTGDYLRQLTAQDALRYPYMGDPYSTGVVNTARYAEVLEYGHAGFHLPTHWNATWEISKEGRPYRHIPFSHDTPVAPGGGASTGRLRRLMPRSVYAQARGLQPGQRLTGFGDLHKQSKSYNYYRQVFEKFPAHLRSMPGYTWKSSPFEGMFVGTMQRTEAAPRHAKYVTIRTITMDSTGWYIPPARANLFATRALDRAAAGIQRILDQAAAADLEVAMLNAVAPLFGVSIVGYRP